MKWLFLVHRINTLNSKERVLTWRLTKKAGAVLYRNSVYVLPYSEECLEDFQWLAQQIKDNKGEASIFPVESNSREEDNELKRLFNSERKKDYNNIVESCDKFKKRIGKYNSLLAISPTKLKKAKKDLQKLSEVFSGIKKVDFFSANGYTEAKNAISEIKALLQNLTPNSEVSRPGKIKYSISDYQKKVWATRRNIHIDRLASAWLIKRFIDHKARFIFEKETEIPDYAVKFDIMGVAFGHHFDNCTFETLLSSFNLKDPALQRISKIVHDIDIKDNKFESEEAAGIDCIVRALSEYMKDDHKTLETGFILFDSLYKYLGKR